MAICACGSADECHQCCSAWNSDIWSRTGADVSYAEQHNIIIYSISDRE